MKQLLSFILLNLLLISGNAQQFIPLWPEGKMPNSKGIKLQRIEARERVTQMDVPGMYAFFTSKDENTGTAVLICPPGGYAKLTYQIAGFQFAKWLNTIGINAFVLMHRLPTSPDLIERENGPMQDGQRALKLIRAHCSAWKINASRIGVMGASAGGHVASTLATHSRDCSVIGDSLDIVSFRPDFTILISPVITMGEHAHKGSVSNLLGAEANDALKIKFSNELHVTPQTPPSFIVHAQNDPVVPVVNSILFYKALCENGIMGSLHVFPEGEHSIALRNQSRMVDLWLDLCEKWLLESGFITNKN